MHLILDPALLSKIGDMDGEQWHRYGHTVVDWITAYMAEPTTYPIQPHIKPGELRARLPLEAPRRAESMEEILSDVESVLLPGIMHWNSAGFMGYFGVSSSGPGMLAEMIDSALNVTRMLWRTAPAAIELEQVVLDWLRQMLGLPDGWFGMIHHNSAVMQALVAARERLTDLRLNQCGISGRSEVPRLRLYASQEAHTSVDKAAIVLGLGREGVRKIGTDSTFRMNVRELINAIEEDLQAGWQPFAVVATVGTTSTTSVDPVPLIAQVCEHYGLWLHVDAAYAGAAAILPGKRWALAGCERADSFSVNPHKWLFTSFGCSVLYTKHAELLRAAFQLTPDYLQTPESIEGGEARDLMDYDFALPHRFPALKLWMVIRYFGQEGLAARIQEHCRLAYSLARWIDATPHFERMAPAPFSVVCFRAHPAGVDDEAELEALNQRIMMQVNATGRYFLSHTRVRGAFTLRVAISNIRTTEQHVRSLWEELQKMVAAEVKAWRERYGNQFEYLIHQLFQYPQMDRSNKDVPNQPAPALDTSSFYQSKPKRSSGYAPGLPLNQYP